MTSCIISEPIYQAFPLDDLTTWTGGARSLVAFQNDCWFGWNILSPAAGTAIGLNEEDVSTTLYDIDWGYVFLGSTFYIIEQGEVREALTSPFAGQRFYILRIEGEVLYCVRPAGAADIDQYFDARFPGRPLPGPIFYVSAAQSVGKVFLDTALYQEGDGVEQEASGTFWQSYLSESPISNPFFNSGNPGMSGGSVYGSLPFDVAATGTEDGETPIDAWIDGELTFTGGGTSRSLVGVEGELPFVGVGFGPGVGASMAGELPFEGYGTQGGVTQTGIRGVLEITGYGYASEYTSAGILGELPFDVAATGSGNGDPPILNFVDGELPFIGSAYGSQVPNNEFHCVLRFNDTYEIPLTSFDIQEVLYALTSPMQVKYVNKITESMTLADVINTFYNPIAEVTDTLRATDKYQTAFILQVADQLNMADQLRIDQLIEIAERLTVAGVVETLYKAIVALMSGVTITDSKVNSGGGSSGGGGGGIIIIDPTGTDTSTGTSGDPAVIQIVGSFAAGTEIDVTYETDTGGETTTTTLITSDSDETQAATDVTADLDAEPDVIATLVP